jgi:peptidoglycan-associated lipoprotein
MGYQRVAVILAAGMVATLACSRAQQPSPTLAASPAATDEDAARRDSLARVEGARRDSIAAAERERASREQRMRDEATRRENALLAEPVHFDYDQWSLTQESRDRLGAKAAILIQRPTLRLRITGHADERGSDEYNLALGQQRAAAVRRYLVELGVPEQRLVATSLGEERPVCVVPEESCWRQNRHAGFEWLAESD